MDVEASEREQFSRSGGLETACRRGEKSRFWRPATADAPLRHSDIMKAVLAYSGGLDTSVIVKWFTEHFDAEVVSFCADIGQEEELDGLDKKALTTGASRHFTLDLVEEFARD